MTPSASTPDLLSAGTALIMLRWWAALLLLGLAAWPFTSRLLPTSLDGGYAVAKVLGLALVSYIVWLGAALDVWTVTRGTVFGVVLMLALVGWAGIERGRDGLLSSRAHSVILQEALFTVAFIAWSVVRALRPEVRGEEKFMDFAFLQAILTSGAVPPPDPWFAGESINYYYFGHFASSVPVWLSGVAAEVGYNLLVATLFALTVLLVARLVADLSLWRGASSVLAWTAGLVTSALLTLGGSIHTLIYAILRPALARAGLVAEAEKPYYYPDPTRFIGHNPVTGDKTITEFPAYAFVISDLHAHLIDLVFVLGFLHLAAQIACRDVGSPGRTRWRPPVPAILVMALFLAIMSMTSAWEAPVYGLVAAGALLLAFTSGGLGFRAAAAWTLAATVAVVMVTVGLALPFLSGFEPFAGGVALVDSGTPLWQLAILYGWQFLVIGWWLLVMLDRLRPDMGTASNGRRLLPVLWRALTPSDRFVLLLVAVALVCIALPELIYVRDIYGADYRRANTMFKLGFQAHILLDICAGYGMARLVAPLPGARRPAVRRLLRAAALTAICAPALLFLPYAINGYVRPFEDKRATLDGLAYMRDEIPEDYAVVGWLRANAADGQVLLEAEGDSYTYAARVSTATGIPTPLGWVVHEWLWRGLDGGWRERQQEVATAFQTHDCMQVARTLERYGVGYIIVGAFERERYADLNEALLRRFGEVVFEAGDTRLIEVAPDPLGRCAASEVGTRSANPPRGAPAAGAEPAGR
jgi:uncharacterized membrane protein